MKTLALLLLIITNSAWALDAVVTVLEAPVFQDKDLSSPVVKYFRKGDIIKVHPSLANDRKYDQMNYENRPISYEEINHTFSLDDVFIPIIDRQGKRAFVLSEHIYVYFNDAREFTQNTSGKDLTDYRLEEPLPKGYPLKSLSGYRGQVLLGFSQAFSESYPYQNQTKAKGFTNPLHLTAVVLRQVSYDQQNRFFFGGIVNFRNYENTFKFSDRQAIEQSYRLGIGPYICYDAYKGSQNRINLFGSILFNLYNQLNITQKGTTGNDERIYRGVNFMPQIGVQYHRKELHENLDFVISTSIEAETPTTFNAKNTGSVPSWWNDLGNDKFTTRQTFSLVAFIGLQSAY
jgi:hypothetical protein